MINTSIRWRQAVSWIYRHWRFVVFLLGITGIIVWPPLVLFSSRPSHERTSAAATVRVQRPRPVDTLQLSPERLDMLLERRRRLHPEVSPAKDDSDIDTDDVTEDDIHARVAKIRNERRQRGILSSLPLGDADDERVIVVEDGTIVREPVYDTELVFPAPKEQCVHVLDDDDRHRLFTAVDNRGYVCTQWSLDSARSGCCISRRRFSCLGCRLNQSRYDGCCDRYPFCVSCCMRNDSTRYDECRYKCMAGSRALLRQADAPARNRESIFAQEFRYCYRDSATAPALLHDDASIVDPLEQHKIKLPPDPPAKKHHEKTFDSKERVEWIKF
jgi:hypothetical protein